MDCSGEGLPNVTGSDGYATRYWDCCKPHGAQFDRHGLVGYGAEASANHAASVVVLCVPIDLAAQLDDPLLLSSLDVFLQRSVTVARFVF